jgi:hypothetical protein
LAASPTDEATGTQGRVGLQAYLRYARHLSLGLSIRPSMGWLETLDDLTGGQDVGCGDREFDRAFRVLTTREDATREVLRGGGAQALLALHQWTPYVAATDEGIQVTINGIPNDHTVGQILDNLAEAVRVFQPSRAPSMYR